VPPAAVARLEARAHVELPQLLGEGVHLLDEEEVFGVVPGAVPSDECVALLAGRGH